MVEHSQRSGAGRRERQGNPIADRLYDEHLAAIKKEA